jgi:NAD-reducing hydrogenase large subunit
MAERIIIDPVTRIEGHAKITIHLNEGGEVEYARFHVAEFRGFERLMEGRPLWEMPSLTARICGICPVSHLIASAKAGDAILGVQVPVAASKLRRLMNLAQIIQSHALSFFHLSAPDLLLGFDSDPEQRHVFGLAGVDPALGRGGIRLRQFGQDIIERLGGKKIHPAWCIPGGVLAALKPDGITAIRERIPESLAVTHEALTRFRAVVEKYAREAESFGNFPSLFLGLVGTDGTWETYDGRLRFVDENRQPVGDDWEPSRFEEVLAEAVEPDSYLKSPYYRSLGYENGMYRVGPLARLNVCERMGTPEADRELEIFRQRANGCAVLSSFFYHEARLIEIVAGLEQIEQMLDDPDLQSDRIKAEAGINNLEGIGCSEAPRGTLFHHYKVDKTGLMQQVNLLIATGQNNLAMNRTVTQIAKEFIRGKSIPEGVLNRVEAGVRAFDPCLSCSTHALGKMPLRLQLVDGQGNLVDERCRN